jgi:hypothetical protein
MAFKGRDLVRTKIVIDKIVEQVNSFNYLGNMISYKKNWTFIANYITI